VSSNWAQMRWAWLEHPGAAVHCTSGSFVWQRMHLAEGVVSSVAYPSSVSVNLERMVSIVSCSWRRVMLPRRVVRAVVIIVLEWRSACCVVSNWAKTSTHWQSTSLQIPLRVMCLGQGGMSVLWLILDVPTWHWPVCARWGPCTRIVTHHSAQNSSDCLAQACLRINKKFDPPPPPYHVAVVVWEWQLGVIHENDLKLSLFLCARCSFWTRHLPFYLQAANCLRWNKYTYPIGSLHL
jgi:hypothetical protein